MIMYPTLICRYALYSVELIKTSELDKKRDVYHDDAVIWASFKVLLQVPSPIVCTT